MKRLFAIAILPALAACGPSARKLDEAMIHEGPAYRVKLVRYHENLPLHYTGEVFRVLCASDRTASSPAHRTQEAGWVTIGNGGAIGAGTASEIASRERANYRFIDDRTIAWIGNGVSVSFDACGSFRGWFPTDLPAEMIDSVEKPEWCRPKGTGDCRHYDFFGDRQARFEAIRVTPAGHVSFTVRSRAFKGGVAVAVTSEDQGRTWATRVLPAPGGS